MLQILKSEVSRRHVLTMPRPLLGALVGPRGGVGQRGPGLGCHVPRARAVFGRVVSRCTSLVLLLHILLPR
jgi:hypothetical protein